MAAQVQENGHIIELSPPSNEDTSVQTRILQEYPISMSRGLHFITILGLIFDYEIVFLSGGVPYWYYHSIHPKFCEDSELGNTLPDDHQHAGGVSPGLREHRIKWLLQLSDVWKAHRVIVGTILALTFPLISVSPLPKCSWAYIFAILNLFYGLITIAVCTFHRAYFNHDGVDASDSLQFSWKALDNSFFHKDNLRFYVSLSLPTVWFVGFITSFAMIILMVMVGEQDSLYDPEKGSTTSPAACKDDLVRFLGVVIPLMFIIAVVSLVRVKGALKIVPLVRRSV